MEAAGFQLHGNRLSGVVLKPVPVNSHYPPGINHDVLVKINPFFRVIKALLQNKMGA